MPDQTAVVADVIRSFNFANFGLDDVAYLLDSDPDGQEWVLALARKVTDALASDQP